MPGRYDVLLWGVYFCDLIFTGLERLPRLGDEVYSQDVALVPGGPFTTAVAMHRLGLRVGWACDFGNDFFSQFVLEAARREGLDESLFTMHSQPVRRISAAFSMKEDRGFLTYTDDVPQASPIPLIEAHQPRFLFLPHLHYGSRYDVLFATARENNVSVYMDCQSTDATLDTPGVVEALRAVTIFAPNEAEAKQLTGTHSPQDALDVLAQLSPTVVIKCGADGALARSKGERANAPAIDVEVVDTTGAGDCFNVGYLYAHLRRDASLKTCLQIGNICGGLSTTAPGGTAIPTPEQVEQYLAQSS